MGMESFEDEAAAEVLNNYFISVKVDREERPDVDHIYMNVCQAFTGSGGWPLTILMTPDKKPFFAGTYFSKHTLLSILEDVRKAWMNNREDILQSSSHILNALNESENISDEDFNPNLIEEAFLEFKSDFDSVYGGFGNAPKFPAPHNLYFLLRYWYKTKDKSALYMVQKTLDSMYKGGIFDHIGYGFSRYSTDRKWLIPHFEKMLYDNALLSLAYLETYEVTGNSKYKEAAEQIFTYILRDMTSPEGGFFSAEDADSEGIEGKFYVWTQDEIENILGMEDGRKFCEYLSITSEGNFEHKNIPNLIESASVKADMGFIEGCRKKVFDVRNKRIHPFKDDKILTSWNGLMIAALAVGARVLDNNEYTDAAERAVNFIFSKLIQKGGRLLARFRDREAALPAYANDYAFLIWGLIELYESTFKAEYLEKAVNLNKDLIKYFWDDKNGGLFLYGSDSEQLITRPKEIYDGAAPSGNSVSALNFLRLARLTDNYELEEKADKILKAFRGAIQNYHRGYSFALTALLFIQSKGKEIVIAGDKKSDETQKMIHIINEEFRPFTTVILYSDENKYIEKLIPFITEYKTIDGKTAAYVCENFSCQDPVTDSELLKQMLRNKN